METTVCSCGFVCDAGRFSCTVTYGDDRTDDKIKDMNILGELKLLLNTVFSRVPR